MDFVIDRAQNSRAPVVELEGARMGRGRILVPAREREQHAGARNDLRGLSRGGHPVTPQAVVRPGPLPWFVTVHSTLTVAGSSITRVGACTLVTAKSAW